MTVYLVRHAVAVGRSEWDGPDALRPLTKKGARQAGELLEQLTREGVDVRGVSSSPAVRCRETVAPLADKLGLEVATADALAEGADADAAVAFLRAWASAAAPGDVVACAHGDLIPEVLRRLARDGMAWDGELRFGKGSMWVLAFDGERCVAGHYVKPAI